MTFDAAEVLKQIFIAGRNIIRPAAYQFSFKSDGSPGERSYSVTVTDDDFKIEENFFPTFDIHLTLSSDDFSKCVEDRSKFSDLYSAKRLSLEGNTTLAAPLLQAFQQWQEPDRASTPGSDEFSSGYLFRRPMGSSSIDPKALVSSAVLRKWVNPHYLQPHVMETNRASVHARPLARYVILDNFFEASALDELIEHHHQLEFMADDVGLNFDSSVVFAEKDKHFGSDLFFSSDWHQYISYIVGAELKEAGKTLVRLRRHDPFTHGFWPHSDWVHDSRGRRVAFALACFNKNWRFEEGGVFQLWHALRTQNTAPVGATLHRWDDYTGKRLSFLETGEDLFVEVPLGSLGFVKKRLLLIDQMLPEYNRVLLCDLTSDPVIHSVSPSCGRSREGFVQWMY